MIFEVFAYTTPKVQDEEISEIEDSSEEEDEGPTSKETKIDMMDLD